VSDRATEAAILRLGTEWACPVTAEQAAQVECFFRVLLEWNRRVNLTGASSMEELVGEHLPDSFALSRFAPSGSTVVDVGAGGGLPSVPFALLRPDCKTTLVEPRAKRTAFLGAALRAVGRPALFQVVRGRDAVVPSGSFGVAASRAKFAPSEWLGLAPRLLEPGGLAVAFAPSDLGDGICGLRLKDAVRYATGRGAPRWAGAYVPRGTTAIPG
jgi:16S rRNA (guanine(527)-N(7))-methyltransferase RsmG